MYRATRTHIRGIAKSDRTYTLLDLACCYEVHKIRQQFHEWMSKERIHFIEQAARRIRLKDEEDLDPRRTPRPVDSERRRPLSD